MQGITGHYVHGELHTFGYVVIKKGSVVPEHHHPHEQITFIVEGQLDMIIDGESHALKSGMYQDLRTVAFSAIESEK